MADIEKTIEGIEAIREFFSFGLPSQNKTFEAYQQILNDALELLREQQAKIAEDRIQVVDEAISQIRLLEDILLKWKRLNEDTAGDENE